MASFKFRIPGQPPSWNGSYRITPNRRTKKLYLGKSVEAGQYQMLLASPAARRAKPDGWSPTGWIRVRYWMHFGHRMDPDNALKVINDGIAHGIDVNDKWFLPCVVEVTSGNKEPYVEIEVEDVEA